MQIAEFTAEEGIASANILYRWIPEEDKIVRHSESSRFFEDITRNTGLSQKELNKNLETKKNILQWLIKQNIRSLKDFGNVMNYYYADKEQLLKDISRNDIKKILGE